MGNDNNRRKFIKNVGMGAAAIGTAGLAGDLSSCKGQQEAPKKEETAAPAAPPKPTIADVEIKVAP